MNHLAVTIISHILAFLTGYTLCLYNSTDDFESHGMDEPQRFYKS